MCCAAPQWDTQGERPSSAASREGSRRTRPVSGREAGDDRERTRRAACASSMHSEPSRRVPLEAAQAALALRSARHVASSVSHRVAACPPGRGRRTAAAPRHGEPLRLPPRRAVLPRRRAAPSLGVRRPAGADAADRALLGVAVRRDAARAARRLGGRDRARRGLVATIARELGAGRTGQAVAALSTAASGAAMAVGHLLSTTTFDLLFG